MASSQQIWNKGCEHIKNNNRAWRLEHVIVLTGFLFVYWQIEHVPLLVPVVVEQGKLQCRWRYDNIRFQWNKATNILVHPPDQGLHSHESRFVGYGSSDNWPQGQVAIRHPGWWKIQAYKRQQGGVAVNSARLSYDRGIVPSTGIQRAWHNPGIRVSTNRRDRRRPARLFTVWFLPWAWNPGRVLRGGQAFVMRERTRLPWRQAHPSIWLRFCVLSDKFVKHAQIFKMENSVYRRRRYVLNTITVLHVVYNTIVKNVSFSDNCLASEMFLYSNGFVHVFS